MLLNDYDAGQCSFVPELGPRNLRGSSVLWAKGSKNHCFQGVRRGLSAEPVGIPTRRQRSELLDDGANDGDVKHLLPLKRPTNLESMSRKVGSKFMITA